MKGICSGSNFFPSGVASIFKRIKLQGKQTPVFKHCLLLKQKKKGSAVCEIIFSAEKGGLYSYSNVCNHSPQYWHLFQLHNFNVDSTSREDRHRLLTSPQRLTHRQNSAIPMSSRAVLALRRFQNDIFCNNVCLVGHRLTAYHSSLLANIRRKQQYFLFLNISVTHDRI